MRGFAAQVVISRMRGRLVALGVSIDRGLACECGGPVTLDGT